MKKTQKKIIKKIKATAVFQWFVAFVCWFLIRLIYITNKKELRGARIVRDFSKRAAIFVFWHGRSMMLSPILRKLGIFGYAVTSRHADGRLMARLQRLFGWRSIVGSTAHGGVSVLRKGVKLLEKNYAICMSPDGPKGPRMRLNDGCLYFAKMSGAPIIPVCCSSTKAWIQKRWDRYLITKFFGKTIFVAHEPIYYDRSNPNEMEDLHKKLEEIMIKQQQELDRAVGLPEILPENEKK